jgi:hypothetical protein
MDLASKALEGNSLPKIRAALESVYALQFQTMVQRPRKAVRQPGIARCESCGKPVSGINAMVMLDITLIDYAVDQPAPNRTPEEAERYWNIFPASQAENVVAKASAS